MLSVVIITKNEQDRIKNCLESVKWADEILVIDNGSTDKTLQIVKQYTQNIYSILNTDFSAIRNEGMKRAKGDWVLYVDSDERVLEPLREEIKQIIGLNDASAYAIPRRNIILGQEKKYGPFWPDWVIRLLKKEDFEHWQGNIHETPKFKGKLKYTKNFMLHLTHRNLDHIVLKSLEWSQIDADLRVKSNHPKMSGWRFLRILFSELFNQGIIRKGFFNGTVGVIDSVLQSFSLFMSYVRLWQLQQNPTLEKKYDEIDEKLLQSEFKYP